MGADQRSLAVAAAGIGMAVAGGALMFTSYLAGAGLVFGGIFLATSPWMPGKMADPEATA